MIPYSIMKKAYKDATKGKKKYKNEAILFDLCREGNLVRLWNDLNERNYKIGQYINFKVYEPKERIVNALHFRDKIVQFIVHYELVRIYEKVFIKTSYACRKGKGTHKAVRQLWENMKKYENQEGSKIIKVDVKKFFYSIDRTILKEILKKKVKNKFYLDLMFKIIDSSPEGETGIPLGNVTSQDFANIYLNELDQYCVRYLQIKEYVRYADDIVIVRGGNENSMNDAKDILTKIKTFLSEKLNLRTNEKTHIFPLEQGVNAFGYKIYTTHILLRDKAKRGMKKGIKVLDKELKEGKIDLAKVKQKINSRLGHARHSNSYNLAKRIYADYEYIDIEKGDKKFGGILRNG